MSLKDYLHIVPSLTAHIFDVLLRFRLKHTALVSDIENAFLNIEVNPKDRGNLRFLWFNDIKAKQPEVIAYRFNRVVFITIKNINNKKD